MFSVAVLKILILLWEQLSRRLTKPPHKHAQKKNPADTDRRDSRSLQRTKSKSAVTSSAQTLLHPTRAIHVALPQLTDCCNLWPHRATRISLRRTLPPSGLPAPPFSSRVRLYVPVAFVSATRFARTGVTSVAVLGCSLSTMTSHPLAVPIPNQLIVTTCDLYT